MRAKRGPSATLAGALLGCALLATASGAEAQGLRTCVAVDTAGLSRDPEVTEAGLLRLVESELDRHPSHRASPDDCHSHLYVELFDVGGRRFVTGRLGNLVPQRERVEESLEAAVAELLTVVLHNDPLRLRGPRADDGFMGAVRRLKRDGITLWGVGILQLSTWLGDEAASIPGLWIAVRRELSQWHVGVRLAVATRPSEQPDALALRLVGELHLESSYYFAKDAQSSGYLGVLVGLSHHWVTGPVRDDPNRFDDAHSVGLSVGARGGVELFRFTRSRLDLFAQIALPAFVTQDEDAAVLKRWLPTLSVGAGLMF